jgi:phage/plasmid primase-like uncharacterized protein/replicative DNA helicase
MRRIDPIQAEESFRDELRKAGLVPPDGIAADGKLHRINVEDEKPGKKSGFYVYHSDGVPAGAYGDWHDGPDGWHTWCAVDRSELDPTEYAEHKRRLDAAQAARRVEEAQRRVEAKERAARIWSEAKPCDEHPYLTRKGVKSFGLRELGGRLVIPIRDRDGEIHSVEFIDDDGGKLFLSGGRKGGLWFELGTHAGVVCVAEGYATAASIHEATGHHTAVAFDCGNLAPVAKQLREKHPTAKIIICADDDLKTDGKNPGADGAAKAAKESNALVAVPSIKGGGDFNDQHATKGLESVDETIQEAIDSDDGPIAALDLFPRVMREIEARKEGKSKNALKFGIPSVDRLTGGMRRGMLTIVAGLPGSGKTAAATGAIVYNASRGVPCLLFSIEMDRIEIGARILSQNSGIPAFNLLDEYRKLNQEEWNRLYSANGRMEKISLTLDDRPVTMAQIVEQAHLWFAKEVRAKGHETGLIAVDYLGLIQSDETSESRNREVAKLAQGVKLLGRKLRVSTLLLAQLNRMASRREGEPELSDLRDSGEVEAAGDLIVFPYPWPRVEDAQGDLVMKAPQDPNEKPVDKWLVKKNKNGPKGAAAVLWRPETMEYTGLTRDVPEARDARPNLQDREPPARPRCDCDD